MKLDSIFKIFFIIVIAAFFCISTASSEITDVVDTPAVGVLDYGCYNINFRLFSDGNILSRLHFGVFKIVNLGIGWEVDKIIGSQNAVVGPPSLYIKVKPFNGGMVLPAFAFGYDGQGYYYENESKSYLEKEKGVFLVFGREFFFPGFEFNAGANINDFKKNTVYGFFSLNINLENKVVFMGEYDRINYLPESRFNVGLRLFINSDLNIDLSVRDIGAAGRSAERIVRIGYTGKF